MCIPTYRGVDRLRRLLGSIDAAAEVIVCDDGTPGGDSIWASMAGAPTISHTMIRHSTNRGCVAAQMSAVAAATGDVILLLDDDALAPPGLFGVLSQLMALDSVGVLSWRSLGAKPGQSVVPRPGFIEPATQLASYCMAIQRSVYNKIGGLDPRFRTYCGDSDLALRATLAGYPSYRVWWPLVPHEEHASAEGFDRASVAGADLAAFATKWGADGVEMERRALAGLRGD